MDINNTEGKYIIISISKTSTQEMTHTHIIYTYINIFKHRIRSVVTTLEEKKYNKAHNLF